MNNCFEDLELVLIDIIDYFEIESTYFEHNNFHEKLERYEWIRSKEFNLIINILKNILDLKTNEYYENIGNSSSLINLKDLAIVLVIDAKRFSIKTTIKNFKTFIEKKEIYLYRVYLLGNLHKFSSTESINFEFDNGVKLLDLRNFINKRHYSIYNSGNFAPNIEMYLTYEFKENKSAIISLKEPLLNTFKYKDYSIIDKKIDNVYLCLILSRSFEWNYIPLIAKTIINDEKDFFIENPNYQLVHYLQPKISPEILEIELNKANELLKKFENLDNKIQHNLDIAIRKISEFASLNSNVDRAISVRVSMESIFLNNSEGNKGLKIRKRASSYLKKIKEEDNIFYLFQNAYKSCSTAVHNGTITDKEFDKVAEVIPYIYDAIFNIIDNGKPSWKKY
ncbi:hypothetical protein [Arcobacter sp. F2176]|uniref:hypothetical protein n=1 Tax=Arcobacter sp. F2176 TaxID=2044511 RepID=UPI00100ABB6C|nr:hypothetical protein [Arcobacter sp. F2176]RXJ81183.1 hypothetical protein CRU95_08200 [Arcobacter sp. F2176]